MASVRTIAAEAGVSVATVSRALNNHPEISEATRRRVLEVADQLGYVHSVGKRPPRVIGLVYPDDPIRSSFGDFESAMLFGVLRGTNEQRFDVTIVNLHRDKQPDETYGQFFQRKGVRGVILRTPGAGSELPSIIADDGVPVVVVADRTDDPRVSYVTGDSRADSARAIEHLVQLGHTRIAIGCHNILDHDHRDRLDAYLDTLKKHGIERDDDLIVLLSGSPEGGAQTIDRVLSLGDPATAVYFTTPPATVGALHRCLELGIRIPSDISIVGFDDADVRTRTFPQYTAVCQDASQLGLEAARWLTNAIAGGGDQVIRVHHETSFDVRRSSGPKPPEPIRLEGGAVKRG
jgi:DNA-binding LacI/PurR family transcriptional regulator